MASREAKKAKTAASWDEVMDPSGDLTLVAGEDKVKLRCARNILRLSSPVLNRMLDPESPFMEGNVTDVSDDGTKHINLPEDEPEPLSLVLRIIHHKTEGLPLRVPLDLLVKLAILSDKYDLLGCMGQWTTSWCDGYTGQDDRSWIFVGFIFKDPEVFRKASKSLILNGTQNDHKTFDTEIEGVPSWVMRKIRVTHRAILQQLVRRTLSVASQFMSTPPCMCRAQYDTVNGNRLCDSAILGDLTRCYLNVLSLQVSGLATYVGHSNESITSYVERLKKLDGSGKLITYRDEDRTLDHSDCDLSHWLLPHFQRLLNSVRGLGLEESKSLQIFVKTAVHKTISLVVCRDDTIALIQDMILAREDIPPEKYRLLYSEKYLEADRTVEDYGIIKESTLHVAYSFYGWGSRSDARKGCQESDHAAYDGELEDKSDTP